MKKRLNKKKLYKIIKTLVLIISFLLLILAKRKLRLANQSGRLMSECLTSDNVFYRQHCNIFQQNADKEFKAAVTFGIACILLSAFFFGGKALLNYLFEDIEPKSRTEKSEGKKA